MQILIKRSPDTHTSHSRHFAHTVLTCHGLELSSRGCIRACGPLSPLRLGGRAKAGAASTRSRRERPLAARQVSRGAASFGWQVCPCAFSCARRHHYRCVPSFLRVPFLDGCSLPRQSEDICALLVMQGVRLCSLSSRLCAVLEKRYPQCVARMGVTK